MLKNSSFTLILNLTHLKIKIYRKTMWWYGYVKVEKQLLQCSLYMRQPENIYLLQIRIKNHFKKSFKAKCRLLKYTNNLCKKCCIPTQYTMCPGLCINLLEHKKIFKSNSSFLNNHSYIVLTLYRKCLTY